MKKKLEAELLSIAHRILKLTGKSDLVQLHEETQRLYEKLSVLRFVEEHMADVKPTIGYSDLESKIETIFEQQDQKPTPDSKEAALGNLVAGVEEKAAKQFQEAQEVKVAETPADEETEAEAQEADVDLADEEVAGTETASETEETEKTAETETAPETASEETPVTELESPEETVAPVEAQATREAAQNDDAHYPMPHPDLDAAPSKATAEEAKEPAAEATKAPEANTFKPAFEWGFEPQEEAVFETPPAVEAKITPAQISFDDLLGQSYQDPIFVKPEELQNEMPPVKQETAPSEAAAPKQEVPAPKQDVIPITRNFADTANVIPIHKSENLNDRAGKALTIGLNDRIAFMNHLFNNSSEDYNRVLSQIITFDSLYEVKSFIDTMVKPDYNNWVGKEEYEQRFMEIIEKRFS